MEKKIRFVDVNNGFGKDNRNVMTYGEIVEQVAAHPYYSPHDTEHSDPWVYAYEFKNDGTYEGLDYAYSIEEIAQRGNIVLEAVQ